MMPEFESSKSLQELLSIEDDIELLNFKCPDTGLMLWPLIRVKTLRTIMSDWLFSSSLLDLGKPGQVSRFILSTTISMFHDLRIRPKKNRDILIQNTGLGTHLQNNLIFDRLTHYFANTYPDRTLVLCDKPMDSIYPGYSFKYTKHKTFRNVKHKAFSKLKKNEKNKKLAFQLINRVAENAYEKLNYEFSPNNLRMLTNLLQERIAELPYATEYYLNWFSKSRLKLLLKEDACYGGSHVSIIHAARLNGIVVAEYQHGAISKGHDAYNVSGALADCEEFKAILPDYLLTYGSWWSKQTNMPIDKVIIGNPHLTESLKSFTRKCKSKILILGDGIDTSTYLNLAGQISKVAASTGLQVFFRPHPFEKQNLKRYSIPRGVHIDVLPTLVESLADTSVLLSELSTGLFEAVGLVDTILVWQTDKAKFAFPEIPFQTFSSLSELGDLLHDRDVSMKQHINLENEIWEPNWGENYKNFVEMVMNK